MRPGCSPPVARPAMAAAAAADAAMQGARAMRSARYRSTEDDNESDHLVGGAHIRASLEGYLAADQETNAQAKTLATHAKPAQAKGATATPKPKRASRAKATKMPHVCDIFKVTKRTKTPPMPKPRAKTAAKALGVKREPTADPSTATSVKRRRVAAKPVSAQEELQSVETGQPVTAAAQKYIILFGISDNEDEAAKTQAAVDSGHTPVITKQETITPAVEDAKHQPPGADASQTTPTASHMTGGGTRPIRSPDKPDKQANLPAPTEQVKQLTAMKLLPQTTEDALHQSSGGEQSRRPDQEARKPEEHAEESSGGSATRRPAAFRILPSDCMEHRVPDLVEAQHRTAATEEAEHGQLRKNQQEATRPHNC